MEMIEIAGTLVDIETLHSEKFYKQLSKVDSKDLAGMLIELTIKHEQLHLMNSEKHNAIMMRKKSVGGITVDA
jgi:hypothetical protein